MIKAPTEDGEPVGPGEITRDAELHSVSQRGLNAAHRNGFDLSHWAVAVTMGGRPQINAPGWEITEVVDNVWQAIAISSRYRFCGQGNTPREALNRSYSEMREFSKELKAHMDATSNE